MSIVEHKDDIYLCSISIEKIKRIMHFPNTFHLVCKKLYSKKILQK